MRGVMKMALIRNNYGDSPQSRRRRDGRGRYMEGGNGGRMGGYGPYGEYEPPMDRRRMIGFAGYGGGAYDAMNDNDIRRRNTGEEDGWFSEQGEDERYPSMHYGAKQQSSGGHGMSRVHHHVQPLTREKAREWVEEMQNEDPDRPEGEGWSMEEAKELAEKHGLPTEGRLLVDFYAALNMMYSDYFAVAEKYGLIEDDFFVCLAKAFLMDRDAVPNKISAYYQYVVKHE